MHNVLHVKPPLPTAQKGWEIKANQSTVGSNVSRLPVNVVTDISFDNKVVA